VRKLTSSTCPARPNTGGQDTQEKPRIDGKTYKLEEAIEGDQPSSILGIPLGGVIPDNDHRNASGKADQDHIGLHQPQHPAVFSEGSQQSGSPIVSGVQQALSA
jgi:hypothetical protein